MSIAQPLQADQLALGVDVGGTTIKAEVTGAAGNVLARADVPTPRGDDAVEAIAEVGAELLSGVGPVGRAAVLIPGIVDVVNGIAVFSTNIGWRDTPLVAALSQRWGTPVVLEHDAIATGWAECVFGAGVGHTDTCVVILGTGVSGALMTGGRLVRGGRGQAGEFGHVSVRPDGIPCVCGNIGCMETISSAAAIAREYTRRSGVEVDGAADVFAALENDPTARAVWQDAVDALADGFSGVIHAFTPELIVLVGGLAGAGDAVTEPLHAALDKRLKVVPTPDVVIGGLGTRSGLVAAGKLARLGSIEATAP